MYRKLRFRTQKKCGNRDWNDSWSAFLALLISLLFFVDALASVCVCARTCLEVEPTISGYRKMCVIVCLQTWTVVFLFFWRCLVRKRFVVDCASRIALILRLFEDLFAMAHWVTCLELHGSNLFEVGGLFRAREKPSSWSSVSDGKSSCGAY